MTGMAYRTRDETLWRDAPLPPEEHVCEPWTVGAGEHVLARCACGASRVDEGPWQDRNSRRWSAPRVTVYGAGERWWLDEMNRHLGTPGGIAYLAEMIEDLAWEAEHSVRYVGEVRAALRVAAEVGQAHLIVRRGYSEVATCRAHVVDGIAVLIADLP